MFSTLWDVSVADVVALNPWIGSNCDVGMWSSTSSDGFVQICVGRESSTTSGILKPPTPTPTTMPSTPTTSARPAPTQPGAVENCKKWHTVISGDGCWDISNQYSVSLDDFYSWNPKVGSDCSNLWLGFAVCVGIASKSV